MNFHIATDQIYTLAELVRKYNPDDARVLRQMAEVFEKYPDIPRIIGTFGGLLTEEFPCPYCGDDPEQAGKMRVIKLLCSTGRDYAAGYRTQWRCDKCGEMEIR
jgi:predicted RNA-binding Zn-ribbon protein involved in translation (DUF1610 family)